MPPKTPRAVCARTAYTPSGGRSLRGAEQLDVQRRIPERSPALIAGHDRARETRTAVPSARRARSRSPCAIDVRIALDEIGAPVASSVGGNDVDDEPAFCAQCRQDRRVALAPAAEPVIVADDELAHLIALLEELGRRTASAEYPASVGVNGSTTTSSGPLSASASQLLGVGREEHRGRRWIDDLERMRTERDEQTGQPGVRARAR